LTNLFLLEITDTSVVAVVYGLVGLNVCLHSFLARWELIPPGMGLRNSLGVGTLRFLNSNCSAVESRHLGIAITDNTECPGDEPSVGSPPYR
jgi:hypothetical protein